MFSLEIHLTNHHMDIEMSLSGQVILKTEILKLKIIRLPIERESVSRSVICIIFMDIYGYENYSRNFMPCLIDPSSSRRR